MLRGTRLRRGFTMIEVLVTLSIIGVLIAILLPAVQAARETARRAQCTNNLKQLGLALQNYEMAYGVLPPGAITWQGFPQDCLTPRRGHSLFTLILPFMEQPAIFNATNFAYGTKGRQGAQNAGAVNYTAFSARIDSLICPSDSRQTPYVNLLVDPRNGQTYNTYSQCSYAGVVGTTDIFRWYCGCPVIYQDGIVCTGDIELRPDGAFGYNTHFRAADFVDGLSSTLLIGEFARFRNDPDQEFNEWTSALYFQSALLGVTRPQGLATTVPQINAGLAVPDVAQSHPVTWRDDERNLQFGQFGFRSDHPGGANFLFGDGHVKFLKTTINIPGVYRPLSTRNGGEVVSTDCD
jgi:prepilin-type N-terminal cleavage/methylation domain-containing protein/prepilin-type processing-associated H-X9-DG protein